MNGKNRAPAPYRELSVLLKDEGVGDGAYAVDETRTRVVRALATFERTGKSRVQAERVDRQCSIIMRCDLGGELHKVVARDLGVSMRTFYRERGEAFERLRVALAADKLRPAAPAQPSPRAVRLERARFLGAQGNLNEAVARLQEMAGASEEPALTATVQARLAGLLHRQGLTVAGTEALSRAKRVTALLGIGLPHAVAEAEIAIVEAEQLRASGRYHAAATAVARVGVTLRPRSTPTVPNAIDVLRTAVVLQLNIALERGAPQEAIALGQDVQAWCSDSGCPSDVRIDFALAVAEAQFIAGAQSAPALRVASEAYAAASAENLPRHAFRAQRLLAAVHVLSGDRIAAISCIETATQIHVSLAGIDARFAALDLAAVCNDVGDAALARRALEVAGAANPVGGILDALEQAREAETLVSQRRFRDALPAAREATRLLSETDSRRYLGEATLTLARAHHGCAEPRAGRAAAADAATLLPGASWPFRVSQALATAGSGYPSVGLSRKFDLPVGRPALSRSA